MHTYLSRKAERLVEKALKRTPVVAILGPRQCGKSTLAKRYLNSVASVYLDLQDRVDLNKLNEPELFFDRHRHELICLDEIQRLPEFFSSLRSEVDRDRRAGRFLILGSASQDLLQQTTETLAGRIAYIDLTPFLYEEVRSTTCMTDLWLRGGFPDSLLAIDDDDSFYWREDFIRTFLERDIPLLGMNIPTPTITRLWRLLAHYHGQTLNFSKLSEAVGITQAMVKKYLAVLEQTYMIRLLYPMESNLKKRLIKSPKIYIRDSGILHSLLAIENFDELLAHPVMGASWEGVAIENIVNLFPRWKPSYIRTSNGTEFDLVLERAGKVKVFEFKASKAPKVSRGFFELIKVMVPDESYIVAPVDHSYEYSADIKVANLEYFIDKISL